MLPVRTNNILLTEFVSVFASCYIWRLPVKLNCRVFLWHSFIILAYLLRPEFVDNAIIQVFEHTKSISESGQHGVYEHANEF